jgi:hypothetical protein
VQQSAACVVGLANVDAELGNSLKASDAFLRDGGGMKGGFTVLVDGAFYHDVYSDFVPSVRPMIRMLPSRNRKSKILRSREPQDLNPVPILGSTFASVAFSFGTCKWIAEAKCVDNEMAQYGLMIWFHTWVR